MKRILLEYLVCPACHESLQCTEDAQSGDEIETGTLSCAKCSSEFPILQDIPRFVTSKHQLSGDNIKTAEAFGWEWQEFAELHDISTYETQFLDWIHPIQPEFLKNKIVLDAGCGMGRFSLVSSRFGAKLVFAVDASSAVETARQNSKSFDNIHVIQADLHHLPFRQKERAQIDFIFCIGVLHHLDVPRAGFEALVQHLKHGGSIFAWVYGRENNGWLVNLVNPLRMQLTSRLPHHLLYGLSWVLAVILQPALKLIYRPANLYSSPEWLRHLLPYNDYFAWLAEFGLRHNHHVVFDHLVAPTAFYIPRDEFVSWFKQADMKVIDLSWRNKNSWRGHGRMFEEHL